MRAFEQETTKDCDKKKNIPDQMQTLVSRINRTFNPPSKPFQSALLDEGHLPFCNHAECWY